MWKSKQRSDRNDRYRMYGFSLVPSSFRSPHEWEPSQLWRQFFDLEPDWLDAPLSVVVDAVMPVVPVEDAPAAPSKSRRRRQTFRVFNPDDVAALEQSVAHLAVKSDRRGAVDTMLRGMKLPTIGERSLAQVPRRLAQACALLRREMPNFSNVIDWMEALLILQRAGDGAFRLPALLLSGPPGVGKTFFAARLAELMQTSYEIVHMESTTAVWVISGSHLGWSSGGPGIVFDALVHRPHANPIIVLDELDKASTDARYPPVNGLYALLEPETAKTFQDEACRGVPLDASAINWIVTANDVSKIAAPLLSRLKVIEIPEPTFVQRVAIGQCVYRDLRAANEWGRRFAPQLEHPAACALARVDGSIRSARSVLTSAFASAFGRRSRQVEAEDVIEAVRGPQRQEDLATIEPRGRA